MEDMKEYWLQRQTEGGEWINVIKSLEYSGLIAGGMIRYHTKGDVCRVIDETGEVIWHAKGVLTNEDAPTNG